MVRVRFPIAAKLILTTAALVLVLSGAFVAEGVLDTQTQYHQFAESRRQTEIAALSARGLAVTRNLADGMYGALLDGDVARAADMVQSVGRGDDELIDAIVARTDGRIVARAKEGRIGVPVPAEQWASLTGVSSATQLKQGSGADLPGAIAFGSPIEIATGASKRREGYLYLEMSTARIARVLQTIEAERTRAVRTAVLRTVVLGVIALLIAIALAVIQGLRFGRAIRHLAQVAAEVGRGNLKARAVPTTSDEIGVLCERFNDMTSRVDTLLHESMEKAALDQELERAKSIQNLLMPPRELVKAGGLTYCGTCESANKMGGDWWHHYQLDDRHVLLCIGDVTGHGIPSAMLTASTKACCDTILFGKSSTDLGHFMLTLDHTIREAGKGELVMTFFAAVFDTERMVVTFANAGHNFPMVFSGGRVRSLIAAGNRLGDGTAFTPVQQPVASGDLVVFFTDGLLECTNAAGEEYGNRRMRRVVAKSAAEDPGTIRARLLDDAHAFYGDHPRIDDITLVVCRVG